MNQSARSHPFSSPTDSPAGRSPREFDVIVVGGGHAGIEAALASTRLGCATALISLRIDRIGEMSCNPAIGGLGKGQLVREIDALGGAMGRLADQTGIQFRMLNTAKGAAVQAPRSQNDRHLYRQAATETVLACSGLTVLEGAVEDFIAFRAREGTRELTTVGGVRLADGRILRAPAVVLTTGTFLRGILHTGESQTPGGRAGEAPSGLSPAMERLGLRLGRLKTGTPPRLKSSSIDWDALAPQWGDARPSPFSFSTDRSSFPRLTQVACHATWTNERAHEVIRANIHRAPMYCGRIQGRGPRYCPSVEDKVMRFPERERHQVLLEPEGLESEVIYVNGVSTSLPSEVQEQVVRSIAGLERAEFLRFGYAVEYDFVLPAQLSDTLAARDICGLFLAGQINGTSGYEEAAAQGLIAGANAALWVQGRDPFVLGRHEAYAGVLVDDLVVSQPSEPYRMFTSRAEYRLLLRQENADARLTPRAAAIGMIGAEALERLRLKEARIESALGLLSTARSEAHGGKTLVELLRRPEVDLASLSADNSEVAALELNEDERAGIEVRVKYEGYLERERDQVERLRRQESLEIPGELEYASLKGLANEAREKLSALRPRTLGAAARIAGVRPPDVALLAVHVERLRRARTALKRP